MADALSIGKLMAFLGSLWPNVKEVATEQLKQQKPERLFPDITSAAILLGLIEAVRRVSAEQVLADGFIFGEVADHGLGERRYRALVQFHNQLDTHQKRRLRKIISRLELTEKHIIWESKKTTAQGGAVTSEFTREKRDYEFTHEDPRVMFLVNMADDLLNPEIGPAVVRDELEQIDFITDQDLLDILLGHYHSASRPMWDGLFAWCMGDERFELAQHQFGHLPESERRQAMVRWSRAMLGHRAEVRQQSSVPLVSGTIRDLFRLRAGNGFAWFLIAVVAILGALIAYQEYGIPAAASNVLTAIRNFF